jgi:hypothetical protein
LLVSGFSTELQVSSRDLKIGKFEWNGQWMWLVDASLNPPALLTCVWERGDVVFVIRPAFFVHVVGGQMENGILFHV